MLRRAWNKGNTKSRIVMLAIGAIAVICIMALIMGLVRFAQWRQDIRAAQKEQEQLVEQYDFDPGDIISDGQFFNAHAMSQAEIQSFLDEQGAACTGNTCLKTITFTTADIAKNDQCSAYSGAKNETAAQIIDKSAQACGISQKVLLTMLQKEQHLVSATNITDFQYKSAMGLSCPDDASCDPQYAGFFNQVYGAAQRYQYYRQHIKDYSYHAQALNYVQYHPNAACGGSTIYISNEATALLYIYTPYQPNTAALQAGDGEGDSCSSYGNRNFSLIYSGWFGNPRK
jgi:hypothetical protein